MGHSRDDNCSGQPLACLLYAVCDQTRAAAQHVARGPRPCENSSAFRARRRIHEKLRIMKLNHPAQIWLDTVLERYIFDISPMYEFSHRSGQSLSFCVARKKVMHPFACLQS